MGRPSQHKSHHAHGKQSHRHKDRKEHTHHSEHHPEEDPCQIETVEDESQPQLDDGECLTEYIDTVPGAPGPWSEWAHDLRGFFFRCRRQLGGMLPLDMPALGGTLIMSAGDLEYEFSHLKYSSTGALVYPPNDPPVLHQQQYQALSAYGRTVPCAMPMDYFPEPAERTEVPRVGCHSENLLLGATAVPRADSSHEMSQFAPAPRQDRMLPPASRADSVTCFANPASSTVQADSRALVPFGQASSTVSQAPSQKDRNMILVVAKGTASRSKSAPKRHAGDALQKKVDKWLVRVP